MERALRVINFRDETERLNLWTSFLNMEFHFGTEDKLILTFKNGCNTCNPKKLHLKLIEIYRKASKLDLMVELARVNK
jgi:rRNA biogenesis protein RRP5